MKHPVTSRLYLLGAALAAGPMIEPVRDFATELVQLLPEPYRHLAVSALGLVIMFLRQRTTAPVSFKASIL